MSIANTPFDMVKGENGVWTYTTAEPQDLGYHNYWMIVDGAIVLDPGTDAFIGYGHMCNAFEVPDPDGGFYELKDVPHGNVLIKNYFATSIKSWRHIYVYTPPDYDKSPTKRYPVLYLQHGGGEDERVWTEMGRTNVILDNLLAEGKITPFIVVMETSAVGGPAPGAGRGMGPGAPAGAPAPERAHLAPRARSDVRRNGRSRRRRVRAADGQRPDSLGRQQLPHVGRSAASRHGGPVDGRHADPDGDAGQHRQVLTHRPLQRRHHLHGRCEQHARLQGEGQAGVRQLRQPRDRRQSWWRKGSGRCGAAGSRAAAGAPAPARRSGAWVASAATPRPASMR